jgi:hypothetical protein
MIEGPRSDSCGPAGRIVSLMGWLRFLRDFAQTVEDSAPHATKAAALERRGLELLAEAHDENLELTDTERAARREEARRLYDEARREMPSIEQPWDDLAARHPGKITK